MKEARQMAGKKKQEKAEKKVRLAPSMSGQTGPEWEAPFEALNKKERHVVLALAGEGRPTMKLQQIGDVAFKGGHAADATKRNSWARNCLRRLVRGGWAERVGDKGDGTYRLTDKGKDRLRRRADDEDLAKEAKPIAAKRDEELAKAAAQREAAEKAEKEAAEKRVAKIKADEAKAKAKAEKKKDKAKPETPAETPAATATAPVVTEVVETKPEADLVPPGSEVAKERRVEALKQARERVKAKKAAKPAEKSAEPSAHPQLSLVLSEPPAKSETPAAPTTPTTPAAG